MKGSARDQRPPLSRSRAAVLDAATPMLLESPGLSLGEVARRLGIGRTTLHRMFPTRTALVQAIAFDALDHLDAAYCAAGLGPSRDGREVTDATPVSAGVEVVVARLIEQVLPLGPKLMFVLRSVELHDDPEVIQRASAMDVPLDVALADSQSVGVLDPSLPTWWLRESLYSLVYVAWEQIHAGRLASRDAAPLVLRTWLRGGGATS